MLERSEIRTTQDGKRSRHFSLATSDVWYAQRKKETKDRMVTKSLCL